MIVFVGFNMINFELVIVVLHAIKRGGNVKYVYFIYSKQNMVAESLALDKSILKPRKSVFLIFIG